jgi:phosphohistidine phosphatase SixA
MNTDSCYMALAQIFVSPKLRTCHNTDQVKTNGNHNNRGTIDAQTP